MRDRSGKILFGYDGFLFYFGGEHRSHIMRKHRRAHVEHLMQPSRWAWAGEVRAVRKLTHTHTHTHTHNGRHGWSARRRGKSGSLGGGRAAEWAFVTIMFHNS